MITEIQELCKTGPPLSLRLQRRTAYTSELFPPFYFWMNRDQPRHIHQSLKLMIIHTDDLHQFNRDYLTYTTQTAETSQDRDLSDNSMVIGTSAIVDTEIDGAVGMNSGIFNNPFIIWGKYRKKWFKYYLPVSFQFHHTRMDGAHAGRFLENLQNEINRVK